MSMAVVVRTSPAGSPSPGADVAVYVLHINQPSLPTPFYSVLVSISVFTAFSTMNAMQIKKFYMR